MSLAEGLPGHGAGRIAGSAGGQASEAPAAREGLGIILLAWAAIALAFAVGDFHTLATTTGSTDDTMRLAQVRAFLDGAGWYGLYESRLDPPEGLWSHWSRLIDVPLAGIILAARPLVGETGAEMVALALWPALMQLAVILGFVAAGRRLAPAANPLLMFAAALACLPLGPYFTPTTIDHHTAQIALALWMFVAAIWAPARAHAAVGGGVLGALLLAVGVEAIHAFALISLFVLAHGLLGSEAARRGAVRWFATASVATPIVFLALTPPVRWLATGCDALTPNLVTMLSLGSLGAAIVLAFGRRTPIAMQLVAIGALGGAAVGLGLAMDPACLAGPMAGIDPVARSLWLAHVHEAMPLAKSFEAEPNRAIQMLAYPALAALMIGALALRRGVDAPVILLGAIMLVSVIGMIAQIRAFTYGTLFASLIIAVAAARLFPGERRDRILRLAMAALMPVLFMIAILGLAPRSAAKAPAGETTPDPPVEAACAGRTSMTTLAAEAPGLVLAHIDLGPAVLLHTRHGVMMAPYHRADRGIAAGMSLMALPADKAHAALLANGVTHLADCTLLTDAIDRRVIAAPLRDAMLGRVAVPWLAPLPTDPAHPHLRFWRVTRP